MPSSTTSLRGAQHALVLAFGKDQPPRDRARAASNIGFISRPERKTNWLRRSR